MFDISSRVVDLLGVGLTQSGAASLTSDTALASAGTRKALGTASMSSDTSATADGLRTAHGAAALSAESSLTAAAQATLYVTITGTFDAVLEGTGNATFKSPAAALTAETSVAAAGAVLYGGLAELTAVSGMTAAATRVAFAAVTASQGSHFGGFAVRTTAGAADLSGDVAAAVAAAPVRIRFGAAALDGDTAVTSATAHLVMFGGSAMSGGATAMSGTPGTVYRLKMATAKRAITDDWLLKRYPIDVGLTLIVKGSTVTEVEVPSQTELAEADYYFQGGRNNPITAAQRAVLVAAGYGSYIEEG